MARLDLPVLSLALLIAVAAAPSLRAEPAAGGEALYTSKCKKCHGAKGEGNEKIAKMLKLDPEAVKFTAKTAELDAAEIAKIVLEGRDKMKPTKDLSAEDAAAIAAYVKGLTGGDGAAAPAPKMEAKGEAMAAAAGDAAGGEALYTAKCKKCHGAKGEGNEKIAKMLKLDPEAVKFTAKTAELDAAEIAKIVLEGRDKMKPTKGVTSEDAAAIAAYVKTLPAH